MLEALPDEMILYIFDYVISDRTNCRELAKIDDLPESIKAGIRKRYPRGEWGWVNTTRSKFWPYVIISKRIGEVILSDLNRTLKSKIKFEDSEESSVKFTNPVLIVCPSIVISNGSIIPLNIS